MDSGSFFSYAICSMKIVISAIVFALLLGAVYLIIKKIPTVNEYKYCYNTAYQVLNEKHIIARRAYTGDEDICVERKQTLLSALDCFQRIDGETNASNRESEWLKSIAKAMSQGTKSTDELVTIHNQRCAYPSTIIEFDPRSDTWF